MLHRAQWALVSWACLWASAALARPTAAELVCRTYPEAAECSGQVVNCNLCHDTTVPPTWNDFGLAIMGALDRDLSFEQALPEALAALEDADTDGDGLSNQLELSLGTQPGDPSSAWEEPAPATGSPNPFYDVGRYDYRFAFKRVSILYCGASPSYEALQPYSVPAEEEDLHERLHEALEVCLDSDHWSKVALPRMADQRIRPLYAAGQDSTVRIGGRRLVIGEYDYDYRLWRYLLTGDRDMRELLTARYHVIENENGEFEELEGVIPNSDPGALAGGQPLAPERRAGMLTTQWFLSINTMFSGLPRTTAAQAYRAYLGADISQNEGLRPVAGEPSDIDDKGVGAAACATCHSTLDPLAYAFARYEGIDQNYGQDYGTYTAERPQRHMPDWSDDVQRSVIFGQEVQDLVEWAEVAADSDEFKRNMAQMFFEHALGRVPLPGEREDFEALWQSLPEDGYSANRLIHRLVDTAAFGVP